MYYIITFSHVRFFSCITLLMCIFRFVSFLFNFILFWKCSFLYLVIKHCFENTQILIIMFLNPFKIFHFLKSFWLKFNLGLFETLLMLFHTLFVFLFHLWNIIIDNFLVETCNIFFLYYLFYLRLRDKNEHNERRFFLCCIILI